LNFEEQHLSNTPATPQQLLSNSSATPQRHLSNSSATRASQDVLFRICESLREELLSRTREEEEREEERKRENLLTIKK
jgi:hypothetical protein